MTAPSDLFVDETVHDAVREVLGKRSDSYSTLRGMGWYPGKLLHEVIGNAGGQKYEWWAQFRGAGGYQFAVSTGIGHDLFWKTREAVGYAPGSGQYPRQKQPEGKSIITDLPDYDLYVSSYFDVENRGTAYSRGYQFIMCVLVPKGERLDINSIPFINNEEAVKIAEQTHNKPPPLTP